MASIIPRGSLAFGLQLPVQSQSHLYAEPWEAGAGVDELTAVARACEDAGFFYIAVCDHIAIPPPYDERMGTEWWDTLTTLGYLAGVTDRIRLLSHVYVLPYRHPLMAAKGFLTLDAVSKGRAVLGVGAGHVDAEFALLGKDHADRGRALDEGIDVVRAAFADEHVSHDGPRYPVSGAGLRPRPVQPGGPPIWIGGSSGPALRRAADKGDGWLPQGPPKQGLTAAIDQILKRRASTRGDDPIDLGFLTGPMYVGEPSFEVERWCVRGSPEQIAEKVRGFLDPRVNHVQVRFRSRDRNELTDQIDAFATEVAPLLQP